MCVGGCGVWGECGASVGGCGVSVGGVMWCGWVWYECGVTSHTCTGISRILATRY